MPPSRHRGRVQNASAEVSGEEWFERRLQSSESAHVRSTASGVGGEEMCERRPFTGPPACIVRPETAGLALVETERGDVDEPRKPDVVRSGPSARRWQTLVTVGRKR